jgi:hypothetical protein
LRPASSSLRDGRGLVVPSRLLTRGCSRRHRLDELVSQNAAKKSTWKWYHVLGLILLNNLVVMVRPTPAPLARARFSAAATARSEQRRLRESTVASLRAPSQAIGITAGSAFYGIGPIAEGSFKSGKIKTEGLDVVADDGPQHVVFESTTERSDLVIRGASGTESKVVLAGMDSGERFSVASTGRDYFAIRQEGVDRISLVTSADGVTDMLLAPTGAGELVLNNDMSLGVDTIRTRNSTMHIRSGNGQDIILAPQGAGVVQVVSALDVAESLTVGVAADPLMVVDPGTRTVALGTATSRADVSVTGDVSFSDTLTIQNGGIQVLNGDVRFGEADVETSGDLTVSGNVVLGDDSSDLITVRGMVEVQNDEGTAVVTIHPLTGDIEMMGALSVEKDTELRGDVVLGSKPTDTVTINAYATQMNSLIATGFVQLGDDDDDTITIYGSLRVRNDNNDIVFDVDPYTGDTFTEGSLEVSGSTTFSGSLFLGDGSTDVNGDPEDIIEVRGLTMLNGDVTIKSTLYVWGDTIMKDIYAENVTLIGMLRLRDSNDRVTFDVDPKTGVVHSAGSLTVEGDAQFLEDIVLGDAQEDHIRFNGQVLMRAALTTEMDVTIMGNTVMEADATVLGDVDIAGEIAVTGNVFLGSDTGDEITVSGHLLVKSGVRSTFTVDPTTGDILSEGSLTARGEAFFENAVEIDAPLTVAGSTIIRSEMEVEGSTTIGGALDVAGDTDVDGELLVRSRLQVNGDVEFGGTDANELTLRSHLLLRNSAGSTQFRVNPASGDTYAAGSLRVDGVATFADSAMLGSTSQDLVTVHGTSVLKADVTAEHNVAIEGELDVHGLTTVRSDMVVHGNVQLGDDVSDTITVVGDFKILDTAGAVKFAIDSDTGDSLTQGSMRVHGNLDVNGYLTTPEFIVEHLFVDRINERTKDAGVMIEGVRFRDGGIDWTKAHEIYEMVDQAGVTVEGVNMKDGAAILSGKRTGSSPAGEIDLLTLVNSGHDSSMADTMTTMKWRQYYEDSLGNHAPVDSGSITVGTANDWTELSSTHNSYMAFNTVQGGVLAERMRITPDGDVKINDDKVVLRAATGDAEISGDMYVGGDSMSRQLHVSSSESEAVVRLISGGSHDAKLSLVSPLVVAVPESCVPNPGTPTANCDPHPAGTFILGDPASCGTGCDYTAPSAGTTSTFDILNDGDPTDEAVLRFTDGLISEGGGGNDLLTITDKGDTGDLFISGNVEVGHTDSTAVHKLVVQSGADAEVLVTAGEASDAAVIVTSGVDQKARLVLVDPADDGDGSIFEIYNDGAANTLPALRFADGDRNDLVSIIDVGGIGELHVTGDAQFGDSDALGPRTVSVQSNTTSTLNVIAGEGSDAFIKITSGLNQQAQLVLLDPVEEPATCVEAAAVSVPGDKLACESVSALSDSTACEAVMLLADPTTVACDYTPSSNGNRLWADGTNDMGAEFRIFNDGAAVDYPTLRITDGGRGHTGTDPENTLMTITDRGTIGDLAVTGNGLFGGPTAVGERTLTVQSSEEARLEVTAAGDNPARVVITSAPENRAILSLTDPGVDDGTGLMVGASTFELLNDGSEVNPRFKITDGVNEMMRIEDQGDTGDIVVSGNGQFGGPSAINARTLTVQSGDAANIEVFSGPSADATLTVQAGANQDAKVILYDPAEGASRSEFQILNKGGEALPTLEITDGDHGGGNAMLTIVDTGSYGDITVSGSGTFGGSTINEDRTLAVISGMQATISVESGDAYDATVTITAGIDRDSKLILADTAGSSAGSVGSSFEIVNVGASNVNPELQITNGVSLMATFIDKGDTGDLQVTGDGVIGGPDSIGPRSLLVQSTEEASLEVVSGASRDAILTITSGVDRNAKLQLVDPADGTDGSTFNLFNYGADNDFPKFKITDVDDNELLHVVDKGDTGDFYVSGSAIFGGPSAFGERSLTVQSDDSAAMNVVSGAGNDATFTITAGDNHDAKLMLVDPASGLAGSTFNIFNNGGENVEPELRITDVDDNVMMTLTDRGSTATLAVTGDATFGGPDAVGPRSVTVQAGGTGGIASMEIISGNVDDAILTINSGADQDSKLVFVDTASGIDGATFELVNRGGENVLPAFEITDGVNTLITIKDNGAFGDMEVSGKVDCVNFVASGSVTLGDGLADEIVINGHIRQEDITFDANSDGTALTLRFTDPTEPRIITFPEETGIVLTSTSAESALEIVGELTAGSIVPGFGSIVTTNNIETVGSGTITAGGQFTATSDIDCQGSVQLGDEAEDNIYVAGTVASGALHATTHLTTLPLDHQTTKLYPIMH